jgi:hypothetical protein
MRSRVGYIFDRHPSRFESNRAGCLIRDGKRFRSGLACLLLAGAAAIGACSVGRLTGDDPSSPDESLDVNEAAYKPDILAMLRVYINDPTQIRDAAISQPMGRQQRYRVCLRLNAKNRVGEYAGVKDYVAVFIAGRLDQLVEAKSEQCTSAAFRPFPEAEKLSR